MTQKKNQNVLDNLIYVVVPCLNFFHEANLNKQILKSLTKINIASNSLKGCVLELTMNVPQDYVNYIIDIYFAPDKIETKKINVV